jgi:hypothetical protein
MHALSGIQTHDPSVRASEVSSCLRPRGHRDRRTSENAVGNFVYFSTECTFSHFAVHSVGIAVARPPSYFISEGTGWSMIEFGNGKL